MRARVLSGFGVLWCALFGAGYVLLVRSQDGDPATAVLVLLAVAVLAGLAATVGVKPRVTVAMALAATAVTMIIGLLSIGVLLAPAVVADLFALLLANRTQKAARTAAMS